MHDIIGRDVEDRVTGIKGVVTGRVEFLTGCNQCLVQPKAGLDGEFRDSQWIDEQRLVVKGKKKLVLENGQSPGFDKAPPRR